MRRLLPAAIVLGIALAAPGGAFACGGGPSAVHVYVECVQNAGGDNPTTGGQPGTQATGGQSSSTGVSNQTSQAIAKSGGKDSRTLAAIVKNPGLTEPSLASGSAGTSPSALGSAFDLGSGPTILLIFLAGTAIVLLGGTGFRFWRQHQRP